MNIASMIVSVGITLTAGSTAQAGPPISCEAWLEIKPESAKLATEINDWIVSEIRRLAKDFSDEDTRKGRAVKCGNLDCMKEGEILDSFGDFCRKHPGTTVNEAISVTGFAEYFARQPEANEGQDENSK